MKFKEYIEKHKIIPIEFAATYKISLSGVYRYMRGCHATIRYAKLIEQITNGEVTFDELRRDNATRKKRK